MSAAEQQKLQRKIDWIFAKYGPDLGAFFRGVQKEIDAERQREQTN